MEKWKNRLYKLVPAYARLPLVCCFVWNCLIYTGTGMLNSSWKHYDFTTDFDRAVPLIPAFVVVYLGCYLFWIVNYIMIARQGREHCMRFVTADMLSRLVCCLFFLLLPTTNVRPVLTGDDIFSRILGLIYQIDAPTNLFPSIHCLVSWFCFVGIRGQKGVPAWYRALSCLLAILVFISTQVTKQHYIIDVFGAILLAEGAYFAAWHTQWYRWLERRMDGLSHWLFPSWEREEQKGGQTA